MAALVFILLYFGLMLVIGMPIIFAIATSALAIPTLFSGFENLNFTTLSNIFATNPVNSNTGLTIILFVIAGDIMSKGQISNRIFNIFAYFLGKRRGFLPIVTVLTCMFYGAVNGSAPATTAAVAAMCFPLMVEMGYDRLFSAALVVASGVLGCIIPPSISVTSLSTYCGGLDLIPLFALSAIEGILCNLIIIVYVIFYCKRNGNGDQTKINAWVDELRSAGFKKVFFESIWAILTPVIILGSIFTGIADTAQSAALALIYSLLVSIFIYKTMTFRDILPTIRQSLRSCGGVLLLVAFAGILSNIMTQLKVSELITAFINENGLSPNLIMLVAMILIVLLGCVGASNAGWVFPLMFTLLTACGLEPYSGIVGVHLIHTTGALTPPVGMCMFILLPMAKCGVMDLGKKLMPYVLIYFLVGALFVFCPWLFTWITAGAFVP